MTNKEILKLIEEIINDEPEYPGQMPDEMYETLLTLDKSGMEEAMRISIRLAKEGILERAKQKLPL